MAPCHNFGSADYSLLCEVLVCFSVPPRIRKNGGVSQCLAAAAVFQKRPLVEFESVISIMHQLTIGDLLEGMEKAVCKKSR